MRIFIVWLLLVLASNVLAADSRPFSASSKNTIERAHFARPFVLAFWSLECAYCGEDIKRLGDLVRKYPDISLITVSVDDWDSVSETEKFLDQLMLPKHERWQFADPDPERLRFRIDPKWYGELPRSYFYNSRHHVHALSGHPDERWLEQWASIK